MSLLLFLPISQLLIGNDVYLEQFSQLVSSVQFLKQNTIHFYIADIVFATFHKKKYLVTHFNKIKFPLSRFNTQNHNPFAMVNNQ